MTRLLEHRRLPWYWVALFYAVNIIAAGGISSLLLLLPFTVRAAANGAAPMVTLVEGKSTLASGFHGYIPVPGVQLRQCDILQTGPESLVQVEFPDGSRIELGPDSRFLSDVPTPVGSERAVGPYFLHSGWLKLTVAKRDNAPPYRIKTPYFDLEMNSGVAVLNVADGGRFFIEQGKALALDPSGTRGGMEIAANQTYSRKSAESKPAVVNLRRSGIRQEHAAVVSGHAARHVCEGQGTRCAAQTGAELRLRGSLGVVEDASRAATVHCRRSCSQCAGNAEA